MHVVGSYQVAEVIRHRPLTPNWKRYLMPEIFEYSTILNPRRTLINVPDSQDVISKFSLPLFPIFVL